MAIKLGSKATDTILVKFGGIAVTRTEFLHGCVKIGVQPTKLLVDVQGNRTVPRIEYFDEVRLKENNPATTPPPDISLGKTVTEPTSGLSGLVVARTEYLHGGPRIGIQPLGLHEGKPYEQLDVDEASIKDISELRRMWALAVEEENPKPAAGKKTPSGPGEMAPRHRIAPRG